MIHRSKAKKHLEIIDKIPTFCENQGCFWNIQVNGKNTNVVQKPNEKRPFYLEIVISSKIYFIIWKLVFYKEMRLMYTLYKFPYTYIQSRSFFIVLYLCALIIAIWITLNIFHKICAHHIYVVLNASQSPDWSLKASLINWFKNVDFNQVVELNRINSKFRSSRTPPLLNVVQSERVSLNFLYQQYL